MDYYNTFQKKKNNNLGSPNLFSFKSAKFNPTPIGFMRNSI